MERYDNLIEKWLLMMLLEIGILLYMIKKNLSFLYNYLQNRSTKTN